MRSIDIYGMFIAALMHDVDHPGNNNNYEVQNKTELAIRCELKMFLYYSVTFSVKPTNSFLLFKKNRQ